MDLRAFDFTVHGRPGRVAWSWWSDASSPSDLAAQKEYVDYAAKRGWEYILVDADGNAADVSELVADADERDVNVFIWSAWTDLANESGREHHPSRWASWGIAGIEVYFMNSDMKQRLQFYDDLLASASERELLVNVHGSIVPVGSVATVWVGRRSPRKAKDA